MSLPKVIANDILEYHEKTIQDMTVHYRLHVPQNYTKTKKYPFLLFLHGAGERGDDNVAQLYNSVQDLFDYGGKATRECIMLFPQCPRDCQWVDTPWADGNYVQDNVPMSKPMQIVESIIEDIFRDYSVDKTRFYVMGMSMGGFGTWDFTMRHHDMVTAAFPMCGGADPSKASLLLNTPIHTFHGTEDDAVPYSGTKEMVKAVRNAGGKNIHFTSYKGCGHNCWSLATQSKKNLAWLFRQRLQK